MARSRTRAAKYIADRIETFARAKIANIPVDLIQIRQADAGFGEVIYLGNGLTFQFVKRSGDYFVAMKFLDFEFKAYIEFDTGKDHRYEGYLRIPISRNIILLHEHDEDAAIERQLTPAFAHIQQVMFAVAIQRGVMGKWYARELESWVKEWTGNDPSVSITLTDTGEATEDLTVSVWDESRTDEISGTMPHGIMELLQDDGDSVKFGPMAFRHWQSWLAEIKMQRAAKDGK